MKLAVSNIAWPAALRAAALDVLREQGIGGIELAPSMEWPDWQVSTAQASAFRDEFKDQGFTISSLQAILFAKPEAQLFGDEAARRALRQHLHFCAELAGQLGAGPLVFGAPKNRLRGSLPESDARQAATAAFREVAPAFSTTGTSLCLEANPTDYGCDFLTHGRDAAQLVRSIGHPSIGLHLDTACLHLAGEDAAALIEEQADILRHFHVSEPFLGGFAAPVAAHAAAAAALRRIGYQGWVVLEMRASDQPIDHLRQAVQFLTATYRGGP